MKVDDSPLISNNYEQYEEKNRKTSTTSLLTTRHPYRFVVYLEVLVITAHLVADAVVIISKIPQSQLTLIFLADSVLAAVAVLLVHRKHWWRQIGFRKSIKGNKGYALCLIAFIPAAMNALSLSSFAGSAISIPPFKTIAGYAGLMLLVGFVEEVYFRGMMVQALKSKGVWKAVVTASFLFGGTHALNLVSGISSSNYVALQMVTTFSVGLVSSALLITTGMLWPLILAHFLTDFFAVLESGSVGGTTVGVSDYVVAAVFIVLSVLLATYLLKAQRTDG
jgi:membrane protease YdiL (CAAX protease family)